MKPEILDTDIVIRRASNGWIVFTGSEYEPDYFIMSVYEDEETDMGECQSLKGLIQENFSMYMLTKGHGGININILPYGHNKFSDEEYAGHYMDPNLMNKVTKPCLDNKEGEASPKSKEEYYVFDEALPDCGDCTIRISRKQIIKHMRSLGPVHPDMQDQSLVNEFCFLCNSWTQRL